VDMSHQGADDPVFVRLWEDKDRFRRSRLLVEEVTYKDDATHISTDFVANILAARDREHAATLAAQAQRLSALEADNAIIHDVLQKERQERADADKRLRDRDEDVATAWRAVQERAQEVALQRDDLAQLSAENERLQAANRDLCNQSEALRAEVERLRAHIVKLIGEKRAERGGRPQRVTQEARHDIRRDQPRGVLGKGAKERKAKKRRARPS